MNAPAAAPGAATTATSETAASSETATDAAAEARAAEPCLHCGQPVRRRLMGCKGGHCPNCRHPYPHGDCSD